MRSITTVLFAALLASSAGLSGCKKAEDKAAPPKATTPAAGSAAGSAPTPAPPPEVVKPTEAPPPAPEVPAPTGTVTADQAGAKALEVMTLLAGAVKAAGDDCAKLGANLAPIKPEFVAMAQMGEVFEKDPAAKKEFEDKYTAKLMETMMPAMEAFQKCKDDKGVIDFMTSMK